MRVIIVIIAILIFIGLGCKEDQITENSLKKLELLSPKGGDLFNVSNPLNVEWQSENVVSMRIILSYNDQYARIDTIANISASLDQYSITDLIISDNCIMRIEDITEPGIFDETTTPFNISTKSITLISPIGGEIYNDGDTVLIKWSSTFVESIQILRKLTNFWEPIVFNINPNETNEYRYTIPIGSSLDFWLKVMDTFDNSNYDATDSSVIVIQKKLTLIEPNGNIAYPNNEEILIKWDHTSTQNENMTISISYDDGVEWETIADNINSTDSEYIFPNNAQILSNRCRIKVEDSNNLELIDISDNSFAIFNPAEFDENYFPMQIGYMWNWQRIWSSSWTGETDTSFYKNEIIGTVVISGIEYYIFEKTTDDNEITDSYIRIDQGNGIIYRRESLSSLEEYFLQLSLPTGYYIIEKSPNPQYNKTVLINEDNRELFGNIVQHKHYLFHHWISGNDHSLAYNFGNVNNRFYDDASSTTETLRGCVINDVVFGDTTLVP